MRHGHTIDLGKNVERQIVLQIEKLKWTKPVASRLRHVSEPGGLRIVATEATHRIASEKALLLVGPKERRAIDISGRALKRMVTQVVRAACPFRDPASDGAQEFAKRSWEGVVPFALLNH